MSRQFSKAPLLVEGFCPLVDAIEEDGDEGEGLAGLPAIAQGLCQQQASQPAALVQGGTTRFVSAQRANSSLRRTIGPLGRQSLLPVTVHQGVALAWENRGPFGPAWVCLAAEQKPYRKPLPEKTGFLQPTRSVADT
jgi:hypothetical protein